MAQILVIDDDPQICILIQEVLELAGYTVVTTQNAAEGLDRFRKDPPQLVITDILMPGREGLETIRDLRQKAPSTKIIAISAGLQWGGVDVLDLARKLGAVRIIQKPFDIQALVGTVREVLEA